MRTLPTLHTPIATAMAEITLKLTPADYFKFKENNQNRSSSKAIPGLGLWSFLSCIFEANEHRPQPLTDEEIMLFVVNQFPDRVKNGKIGNKTINECRRRFNYGEFHVNYMPDKPSFRYDSSGKRVNGRNGKVLLTADEITATIHAHAARKESHDAKLLRNRPWNAGRDGSSESPEYKPPNRGDGRTQIRNKNGRFSKRKKGSRRSKESEEHNRQAVRNRSIDIHVRRQDGA